MRHPAWGVVPPAYFIPDDKDPHFRGLSEFVIGRAIEDWRYLLESQGPVDLSINLPVSFFGNAAAVRDMCRAMPTHPAFAGLVIEIDSTEVIDHPDLAVDAARRLRLHNIALAIDTVGAEWPSLMGLRNFPFVELKVDHQFVTGCADDRLKQAVCRNRRTGQGPWRPDVAQGIETRSTFSPRTAWDSIWCRAICSASRWGSGNLPASRPVLASSPSAKRPERPGPIETHSNFMSRSVSSVGAEAGRDDDAAAHLAASLLSLAHTA